MPPLPSLERFPYEIGDGNLCIAQGRYLLNLAFDMEVWLPTRGMNLQRSFVWNIQQQRSFIESVMVRRPITPISVIYTRDDTYEVIDGKQRLTTLLMYLQNKFEFCGYTYDDLPVSHKGQIDRFYIRAYRLVEDLEKPVTDQEKIEWFRWINFAGTPQDINHMKSLE